HGVTDRLGDLVGDLVGRAATVATEGVGDRAEAERTHVNLRLSSAFPTADGNGRATRLGRSAYATGATDAEQEPELRMRKPAGDLRHARPEAHGIIGVWLLLRSPTCTSTSRRSTPPRRWPG